MCCQVLAFQNLGTFWFYSCINAGNSHRCFRYTWHSTWLWLSQPFSSLQTPFRNEGHQQPASRRYNVRLLRIPRWQHPFLPTIRIHRSFTFPTFRWCHVHDFHSFSTSIRVWIENMRLLQCVRRENGESYGLSKRTIKIQIQLVHGYAGKVK